MGKRDLGEDLYNSDLRENPGGKGMSRRDFLVDVAEELGGKEGKKGRERGR